MGNPEEERYRLMQAVTGFLSNAATVQPMLVVLEDLHNGNKGTLEMLTHVSRDLTRTRGTFSILANKQPLKDQYESGQCIHLATGEKSDEPLSALPLKIH